MLIDAPVPRFAAVAANRSPARGWGGVRGHVGFDATSAPSTLSNSSSGPLPSFSLSLLPALLFVFASDAVTSTQGGVGGEWWGGGRVAGWRGWGAGEAGC